MRGESCRERTNRIAAVPEVIRRIVGGCIAAQVEGTVIRPGCARSQRRCAIVDGVVIGCATGQGWACDGGNARLIEVFVEGVTAGGVATIRREVEAPTNVA